MNLDIQLLDWQQEVWNDPTRFKVVAAGRRTGKSRLAAYLLVVNGLQAEKGHVFYVAPTQGQARDIMWNLLLDVGKDVIKNSHVNNMQITLINDVIISLKGADRPETMRGVSLAYLVMDEYADMKPDVWELILRPALADYSAPALFIGTPMGRNHFYDLYRNAEIGDDPDFSAWHYTSYDNNLIDKTEIDRAKKSMSSYAFRQEFMASFEARGSEMFKEDWVHFDENEPDGDYYIAVDLAGFEEIGKKNKTKNLDNTAIAVTKVNQQGWWVADIIVGRWTLDQTAVKIFRAVQDYRPVAVGIEKGIARQAVMSPLSDLMAKYSRFFRVEELTHGNRKKVDRVMWALQGRFENGLISLNKGDWNYQFMDELFQFPDVLTHDDMVDALAYIDQLAKVAYSTHFEEDTYEVFDSVAGY